MATTKAQQQATAKYKKKAYDRLEIIVQKGKKADLQAYVESRGESLTGFVNRAIDETIERDNGSEPSNS